VSNSLTATQNNKSIREEKTIQFKIEAKGISTNAQGQQVGKIEAFGAMYNNVDDGGDKILPTAFSRTVKNSKTRAESRNKPYLLKMLWQHKTDEVIGGWYDVDPNDPEGLRCKGDILLSTQRGQEYYDLAIAEMMDEFSIIYEVMPGGSTWTKDGVRELSELRLFSVDPVTWGMNDKTYTVGIKSMDTEQKTACGSTSGPIGPRDESWSGSAAEKWIWGKALGDDDKVKSAIAKKYFMKLDGDPTLKGSYGYPFWINDHISVGGVKAVAGALSGARNADAGGDTAGMKKKVETLYRRINSKYPEADPLTPPWKDDDGKSGGRDMQLKTLMEHYNQQMACDLLRDWSDVYLASLTQAIFDAFTVGDVDSDVSQALDDFKALILGKFVQQAEDVDLCGYLADNSYSYTPGLSAMQNGSGGYGYMSRSSQMDQKAGKPISAANQKIIDDHVKAMKSMAKQAKADMQTHVDSMNDTVDSMSGSSSDSGKSLGTLAQKAGRPLSATNANALHDMADKAMSIMQDHTKALSKAANGLADAVTPPVSDTDGEDPMDDQDEQVEKSLRDGLLELKALSA
jgi:HK97 family phage prohead protease